MTNSEYEAFVRSNAKMPLTPGDDTYSVVGLAGETGEVAEWVKKVQLRGDLTAGTEEDLLLELGDVLHYLTRIALNHGWSLETVMNANQWKLDHRPKWS